MFPSYFYYFCIILLSQKNIQNLRSCIATSLRYHSVLYSDLAIGYFRIHEPKYVVLGSGGKWAVDHR